LGSGRHDFQPRALPAELPRCWALCSLRKLRKISPSRTVIPYNWRVGAQLYRDFLSFQEGGRQAWSSASGSSVDELWSRCGSLTPPQFPRMRPAGVVCSPRLGHCRFDDHPAFMPGVTPAMRTRSVVMIGALFRVSFGGTRATCPRGLRDVPN
jgi:hypothetical protein